MSKTVEALQMAFTSDPNAIHALIVNRIPCNQFLADDPFVQVDQAPVLPSGNWQVGAIGLVNAVLAANGLPLVAAKFSDECDSDGRHKLLGFCEYVLPEKTVEPNAVKGVSNWIPITEQLPERGKDVLFCCLIDNGFTRVDVGRYNGDKTLGDAIGMDVDFESGDWAPCSHWMPLPEPPLIDEQNVVETQRAAICPLNLNTYVRFKMKPRGVEVARAYFSQCGFEFPNVLFPVDQPDIECRQQFHELFRIFGGRNMRHDSDGNPIYGLIVEPMPR